MSLAPYQKIATGHVDVSVISQRDPAVDALLGLGFSTRNRTNHPAFGSNSFTRMTVSSGTRYKMPHSGTHSALEEASPFISFQYVTNHSSRNLRN